MNSHDVSRDVAAHTAEDRRTRTRPSGELMEREIGEQPEVLARVLTDADGQVAAAAAAIVRHDPEMVVLTARGSSNHAAMHLKYLVEIQLGLAAGLSSPSSTTIYGASPWGPRTLVVVLSQSGGSPDLIATVESARSAGALTLAITNAPTSRLATAADLHIDLLAGPELSVAATKSYTAELAAASALVAAWRVRRGQEAPPIDPGAVRDAAGAALALRPTVADLAADLRAVHQVVLTGRGFAHATAREGALKLMETCYLPAFGYSAADVLHGPFALLGPEVPTIALTPAGSTAATMADLVARAVDTGSPVITIGPGPAPAGVRHHVPTTHTLADDLAPLVDVIPLQLLALDLARARGLNPDAPRALQKVTKTL